MAEIRIDCLYEACPIPLVRAIGQLKKMTIGDVLVIETDHSCATKNFTEWTQKNGLSCQIIEVANGEWEIRVKKDR